MTEHNPYRPPQAELTQSAPSPALSDSGYSYVKDPRALTKLLVTMLWISLGLEVISLLSDAAEYSLLGRSYTEAEATANDNRQALIGLVYLLVYIVTVVVFAKWIYRANINSRGFGANGMRFSPGWSVGYYFIPFINLVRPYQAMKEILQVSEDPKQWAWRSVPAVIGWWWALWLICSFAGNLVFRLSLRAETIDELQTATGVSIAAGIFGIPLCLVAMKLVKTIAANQEDLVQSSRNGVNGGPTPVDTVGTG